MGVKVIDIVQLLADRIHQGGYTQRALEDDIYAEKQKRIAVEKDRDHWKTARQEAIAAGELMQAEIETLKGAMAADDKRLRDAEERVWPGETRGCDAPDAMADEILSLRTKLVDSRVANINLQGQLDAARAETVDVRKRLNEETDRHRATNAEKVQHWDHLQIANKNAAELVRERDAARSECETLRKQLANAERSASDEFVERQVLTAEQQQDAEIWQQQLDAARAISADLQQQLDVSRGETAEVRRRNSELVAERDAALTAVSLQRAGIERLNAFVERVRSVIDNDCDGLEIDEMVKALAELNAETEPAPCSECERWQRAKRIDSELVASKTKEIERLQAFVGKVRSVMDRQYDGVEFDDLSRALDELDAGTEPAPATEPAHCPECETALQQLAEANKQWQLVAQQREQDRQRLREYEQIVAQSNSAIDAARKKITEQSHEIDAIRAERNKLQAKNRQQGDELFYYHMFDAILREWRGEKDYSKGAVRDNVDWMRLDALLKRLDQDLIRLRDRAKAENNQSKTAQATEPTPATETEAAPSSVVKQSLTTETEGVK